MDTFLAPDTPYLCWIGEENASPAILFENAQSPGAFERLNTRIKGQHGQKGTAVVLPDGRIMVCGPRFGAQQLSTVAAYATAETARHLYHLRVVTLDAGGTVSAVHEDSSLWPESIDSVGDISKAAKALAVLDGKAWMWFGTEAETQFLLVSSQDTDPDARLIRAQIRVLAHHFSEEPIQAFGVLSRLPSGALSFVTDAPLEKWFDAFQHWFIGNVGDGIECLDGLRVVQVRKSDMIGFKILGGQKASEDTGLSALRDNLLAIPEQKRCGFVFSKEKGLFLSRSKQDLQTHYGSIPSKAKVRGQIENTGKGYFLMRVKEKGEGTLSRVAQWWHSVDGPQTLPELAELRLVQVNSEGEITLRQKQSALWTQK